jgi:ankyrin repeat protein
MVACKNGFNEIVAYLLQCGADKNLRGSANDASSSAAAAAEGNPSAFHIACKSNNINIIEQLIFSGAFKDDNEEEHLSEMEGLHQIPLTSMTLKAVVAISDAIEVEFDNAYVPSTGRLVSMEAIYFKIYEQEKFVRYQVIFFSRILCCVVNAIMIFILMC